jgi:class 3 adenylate cyclase/tetratricopeptide (TPR) repeat protein
VARSLQCSACGERNPARARFCLGCGIRLTAAPPVAAEAAPIGGERRIVTAVFADLSGFTSFSERSDPEEARALVHEAMGRLSEIVLRYGGSIDKIMGDGLMAVFGAPIAHEDDPERAVRAALDMQDYVAHHREKFAGLPLRIGVNTGQAIFAPVGPQGQDTVIGDTVNTAARLQTAAGPGEILVGEATYRGAMGTIEFEPVPLVAAKGKEAPLPVWRARAATTAGRVRPGLEIPLVGRTLEFDRLWELWERARAERRPLLATLIGPPGIGKSRLVAELGRRLEGTAPVLRGRCLSYGEGITYWPVIEIIRQAVGLYQDDPPESLPARLEVFVELLHPATGDEGRSVQAALANLLGLPGEAEISQGELHWGVRRTFQLLSRRWPLLVILEDLHWAEPTLLELLEFLLEEDQDSPILLLVTGRPELEQSAPSLLTSGPRRRVIEVEALGDRETEALLEELLGLAGLPRDLVAMLLRTTQGNPLYVEETVRMLTEAGLLGEDGSWRGEGYAVAVPDSLRTLIGSRLDRLPPELHRLALRASVMGDTFWPGAVAYLDDANGKVPHLLERLAEQGILYEQQSSSVAGERQFSFRHALVREVAYDRLSKAERSLLHARFGDWVAKLPGADDRLPEIIAYHLEQACLLAWQVARASITPPLLPAVEALTRAGEKAEGREGTREAERYYSRAIDLAGSRLPETSSSLRLRHSGALASLGEQDRAGAELAELADRSGALGRTDLRSEALLKLAGIDQAQGRVGEALRRLEEAQGIASKIGERRLEVRAAYERASLRADFQGEVGVAVQAFREAIAGAEELGDPALQAEGHLRLGNLLLNMGELAGAEEHFARSAALGEQEGRLRDQARATHSLALVKFYRGDTAEAEELALRSLEWLQRTADRYLELQNLRTLAKMALAREDFDSAARRLGEALPMALHFGGWLVVEINRYLAEVLSRQDRLEEARASAAGAWAILPAEDPYARAAALLADGFVATAAGDETVARKRFAAAVPLLEEQRLEIDLGEARIAYARALARFGDEGSARAELDRAAEMFSRMGAEGPLAEIARERGRLGVAADTRRS